MGSVSGAGAVAVGSRHLVYPLRVQEQSSTNRLRPTEVRCRVASTAPNSSPPRRDQARQLQDPLPRRLLGQGRRNASSVEPVRATLCETPVAAPVSPSRRFSDASVEMIPVADFLLEPAGAPSGISEVLAYKRLFTPEAFLTENGTVGFSPPGSPVHPLSWERSMLESQFALETEGRNVREGVQESNASCTGQAEAAKPPSKRLGRRSRKKLADKPPVEQFAHVENDTVAKEREVTLRVRSSASARSRRIQARRKRLVATPPLEPSFFRVATPAQTSAQAAAGDYWAHQGGKEGGVDCFSSFMSEIGRAKLLTREEEIDLTKRLKYAIDLKTLRARLSEEQKQELSYAAWARQAGMTVFELRQRLREGDMARQKLIATNMRLVVSVAKKYSRNGMPISDLIAVGTMGLARGVDKFDPSRGFKLSTYVHWWIRQAVTRAVADYSRTIRLPMHVHETLARVKKAKAQLMSEGTAPSNTNLASVLGLSERKVDKVQKLKTCTKSLEEIVRSPSGFEEGSPFEQFLHDPEEEERVWGQFEADLLRKDVQTYLLSKLDQRERDIVCMHYGLRSQDGAGMTLDNISLRYGVSRERIRQVETVAMRKLRVLGAERKLQQYCY